MLVNLLHNFSLNMAYPKLQAFLAKHAMRTNIEIPKEKDTKKFTKISASADGGLRSRVCARKTLRSAPHGH